jgi:hypothetical protein
MNKNQNGYVMVVVLLIMSILTIIATVGLRVANTELDVAVNNVIYQQNFSAAEGAMYQGSEWAAINDNTVWEDTATDGLGAFTNGTSFTFNVEYWKNGGTDVITHFDPVTTLTLPELLITGTGRHVRGGNAVVKGVWVIRPIFFMPETPLWVFDTIKGQGNVEVRADTGSGNRDEVWFSLKPTVPYDLPPKIECPDGDGCSWNTAPEPFPTDEVRERVKLAADYSGPTFPSDLVAQSSPEHPVVVYIDGNVDVNDGTLKKNENTGKFEGFGVLFIDGSSKINGNIRWNGLIVVRDSVEVGNGTASIEGALIAGHNTTPGMPNDGIIDVSLSGAIDVNYNRAALSNLRERTSQPVLLSWFD